MITNADPELQDDFFAGNLAAFRQLQECLQSKQVLVFSGAGISAPIIPTWYSILRSLIGDAQEAGVLSAGDASELSRQIEADPLEVASNIEEAFTPSRFRAKLAEKFDRPEVCTDKHELLMSLPVSDHITLNYDPGLSNAFVKRFESSNLR